MALRMQCNIYAETLVNDKAKYIGLVIIVFVLPISIVLASYEGYKHYKHYRWKQEFDTVDDPERRLSIPSDNEVLLWEYRPRCSLEPPVLIVCEAAIGIYR